MLNAFLLFGRSPHKPPPPSRQDSYNLEDNLPNRRPSNPRHPAKDAQKMVQKVSALASSSSILILQQISLLFQRSACSIGTLPSPRTAVLRSGKNYFSPTFIFSTHQNTLFSLAKIFSVFSALAGNAHAKQFFPSLHTTVFPAACYGSRFCSHLL